MDKILKGGVFYPNPTVAGAHSAVSALYVVAKVVEPSPPPYYNEDLLPDWEASASGTTG